MRFAIRRTIIQHIVQFFVVQFFHPLSNDNGRYAVTDLLVSARASGHKAVDTEDQRQTRYRQMARRERRRQHDKTTTRYPAAPLEESSNTINSVIWWTISI